MKRALLALLIFCTPTPALCKNQGHYSYETIERKSGAVSDHSHVRFDRSQPGVIRLEFERGLPDYPQKETYVFSEEYDTQTWKVENALTATDYTGVKKNDRIVIKGRLNDEPVAKELSIDDKPFYAFPKFELMPLASAKEGTSSEFWVLRRDSLDVYEMTAVNKGTTTIQLHGVPTRVVAIHWYPSNPLLRMFKRTYYYRLNDGLFVKQEYPDGRVRELVEED
jgi:uncharacterized protein YdeI (BOF family)